MKVNIGTEVEVVEIGEEDAFFSGGLITLKKHRLTEGKIAWNVDTYPEYFSGVIVSNKNRFAIFFHQAKIKIKQKEEEENVS